MNNPIHSDEQWFKPGDRLGDYRVVRVMNPGHFSYNLEVEDSIGRRYHAVVHKRVDVQPDSTRSGIRFEAGLIHPGLPSIEHVGEPCDETRNHVWFVRELLPDPMSHRLRDPGQIWEADEVLRAGLGVCQLFEYLHDEPPGDPIRPVVHGFLFPGYIHRTADGKIKVAGLDVQILVRSGTEMEFKNRLYRSPECVNVGPHELGRQNDLWALAGCMLYLATGREPIEASTNDVAELVAAHQRHMPRDRALEFSNAPLREILSIAFAEEPCQRFRNAHEFGAAIESALRGESIPTRKLYDVFLAYGRQDEPTANMVRTELQQDGIHCWDASTIDTANVALEESLATALSQCRLVVPLLSSKTTSSRWVPWEIRTAIQQGAGVLAVRLDHSQPSLELQVLLEHAPWFDMSGESLKDNLDRFVAAIRRLVFCPSGFHLFARSDGALSKQIPATQSEKQLESTEDAATLQSSKPSPRLSVEADEDWREKWPGWHIDESKPTAALPPTTSPESASTQPAFDDAFSSHTILVRYPTPIAAAYRRFVRQPDPPTRLQMLFSTFEATLRYLVTIGVTELFYCLANTPDQKPELPEHQAFDFLRRPIPMSLGMWVDALREIAQQLAAQKLRFVAELPACCGPDSDFIKKSAEWLVSKRNSCIHKPGGIPMTPDECHQAISDARPWLERALQQVEFVCLFPLGFAQRSAGFAGDQGRYSYRIHACMGARVDDTAMAFVVRTSQALQEQVPFIVAPDGSRLLYLWPLLHERLTIHSGLHSLYVFEKIPKRRGNFLVEVELTAIDSRDLWQRQLCEGAAASHAWIFDRMKETPAVQKLSAESKVAARLLPQRGGELVGKSLGAYRLKAVIAKGGFGTIYLADNAKHGAVAVKVIASADSSRHFARYCEEVKRLRQAESPSIIRHLDDDIELLDGVEFFWYAMEFAAGGDLSGRIAERQRVGKGTAPWKDRHFQSAIVTEFRSILAGVAHLHQMDIIHRDIKPGNILILDNGELRLSDFGLAKHLNPADHSLLVGPRTSTGAVLGTRNYMAPEQERGEDVDKPADVYALGVLLAELTCGKRPQSNLFIKAGSTLSGFRPLNGLPTALRKFVRCCTDIDPKCRFQDASIAQAEFEKVAVACLPAATEVH